MLKCSVLANANRKGLISVDHLKKCTHNACSSECCSGCGLNVPARHTYRDETGDACITAHSVFPGIQLIYNSVHMDCCSLGAEAEGRVVELHHCREGRIEQQFGDTFFYLMPGDLSISIRETPVSEYRFPLRHYHGISIVVDTKKAPRCLSCFLEDVNVQPLNVAKKLCGDRNCFILRQETCIEHIFSELYSVPESYRKGYFKIKIMELLLVLSGMEPGCQSASVSGLSREQAELAKQAAGFLAENMDQRITVADLAARFHVSQTHLQNAFRGVYGVPVFSYMRIQKMQAAALRLIHTEQSVMEIASEYGYDNASKFASAFREIMGETPVEYRKMHSPAAG